MNPIRGLFKYFLVAFIASIYAISAYALTFTVKSKEKLHAKDTALGAEVLAVMEKENFVIVDIKLGNDKQIIAQIDYSTKTALIRSLSRRTGSAVAVTQHDISILNALRTSLDPSVPKIGKIGDALLSLLNFLSETPPGEVINIFPGTARNGSSISQGVQIETITSLCDITGQTITGTYSVKKNTFNETVTLGTCYSEPDQCLGRCGLGCGFPPVETIQRFAQDCLNHDLCTGSTGKIFGPCRDEWRAAADDFLFADDCGDMTDSWGDNFAHSWSLTQAPPEGSFTLSGNVDVSSQTPQCPVWTVSGTHTGSDIVLTATNPPPIEDGCCNTFTYVGALNSCGAASGTWTNGCGAEGTWTMDRQGTLLLFGVIQGAQPTAPSRR